MLKLPPTYDSSKSINTFINDAETFLMDMQQSKYMVVLYFVNEWTKKSFKSLTEFKNMREITLLKDVVYNKNVIRKYIPKINYAFGIELNINKNNVDDIDDKYIISLLKYMLKLLKLKYELVKYVSNNNNIYSIKKIDD